MHGCITLNLDSCSEAPLYITAGRQSSTLAMTGGDWRVNLASEKPWFVRSPFTTKDTIAKSIIHKQWSHENRLSTYRTYILNYSANDRTMPPLDRWTGQVCVDENSWPAIELNKTLNESRLLTSLKDSLNAVRRPLTQYTVVNCVSHFNSIEAKRAVAEKMMFIS